MGPRPPRCCDAAPPSGPSADAAFAGGGDVGGSNSGGGLLDGGAEGLESEASFGKNFTRSVCFSDLNRCAPDTRICLVDTFAAGFGRLAKQPPSPQLQERTDI